MAPRRCPRAWLGALLALLLALAWGAPASPTWAAPDPAAPPSSSPPPRPQPSASAPPAQPATPALPPLIVRAASPQLEEHVRRIVAEVAPRLAAWVGASPPRLEIEVAANEEEFKARVAQLEGPRWAAGLALPGRGLILLRSPRQLIDPEQFRPLVAHELTHLYLAAALRHREHPLWLEEGLAMYAAGEGGWERAAAMAQGVLQGRLIPLARLEESFPQDSDQAALAYAQSYYMVSYLINHHGPEVLPRIIAGLARGQALTSALREATGQGVYSLEMDFQEEMRGRFSWLAVVTAGTTLWVLISLLAAWGLVMRRREQKARMAAMPDGQERPQVRDMRRHWPPGRRPRSLYRLPPVMPGRPPAGRPADKKPGGEEPRPE